ncbi:cupin domain-containing protein [Asaia sp. As-1742]|nr:cupin domain-containing protein [Asaia sp. As-1742]NIE81457.1 cupin domain-containing protein [Asaia sp. As-1742]
MQKIVKTPCSQDIYAIRYTLARQINGNERFDEDTYLNDFIKKPWGHEYRVYCDSMFDVWKLRIDQAQTTSMHCHLHKDTVLLCLGGTGTTTFIDGAVHYVTPGSHIYIPRGVFHQTAADRGNALHLVEVENPRNKFDLLRISDPYGRKLAPYEGDDDAETGIEPMEGLGPGRFMRRQDTERKFRFQLFEGIYAPLLEAPISVISLDLRHHVDGRIRLMNSNGQAQVRRKHTYLAIFPS